MQLSVNGTQVIGRQLRIDLADKDSGQPYVVRMNEDGSYLHKFRGNKAFMSALGTFERTTLEQGKPIREVWISMLKEHLASSSI
jgi:hypothetical protein